MFFVPGIVVTVATFPGVVVHELAHQLFCRLFGVAVYEVKYFQVGNPAGYVIHEIPKNPVHSLFISIGPFFLNTLLGILIAFPAIIPYAHIGHLNITDYFLMYLGVSIAMHAFPSIGDANNIMSIVWHEPSTPLWLKIICLPICCIIYLGAIGSFFWLDLLYGIAVTIWLPMFLLKFIV
ncbi:metalloprotease family protein [Chitinophaga sp. sic0106]|uniref:metalloprotease family protein n=1 Tax=Chitinophaga sp. sic0106 TaxID=2854785 RepID=UPI001C4835F8|nr:metalloprotease family protein [Chitinophaga sp. sic0106]MBV7528552.1 DUF3267 domain-containing protein [Chitinophaga sp. sic0106]